MFHGKASAPTIASAPAGLTPRRSGTYDTVPASLISPRAFAPQQQFGIKGEVRIGAVNRVTSADNQGRSLDTECPCRFARQTIEQVGRVVRSQKLLAESVEPFHFQPALPGEFGLSPGAFR